MRYTLPDLLVERSDGVIESDGYDYVGPSNAMVVFLRLAILDRAKSCIADVIANVRCLRTICGQPPRLPSSEATDSR